jgi:hypothetical protein
VNPPLGDEYRESYRQVYSVMASLKRGECHLCYQKVKFRQSGEDVVGSCGDKLYRGGGSVSANPPGDPEPGASGETKIR